MKQARLDLIVGSLNISKGNSSSAVNACCEFTITGKENQKECHTIPISEPFSDVLFAEKVEKLKKADYETRGLGQNGHRICLLERNLEQEPVLDELQQHTLEAFRNWINS